MITAIRERTSPQSGTWLRPRQSRVREHRSKRTRPVGERAEWHLDHLSTDDVALQESADGTPLPFDRTAEITSVAGGEGDLRRSLIQLEFWSVCDPKLSSRTLPYCDAAIRCEVL